MKTYCIGCKVIWYDTKIRLWTLQHVDAFHNQIGEVMYVTNRREAFDFLNGKIKKEEKPKTSSVMKVRFKQIKSVVSHTCHEVWLGKQCLGSLMIARDGTIKFWEEV